MTGRSPQSQDIESRLQELQDLADEGLITADQHDAHRRRIREEAAGPALAMHGNALELLDDLIRTWSRWGEHERYYLEELAPRIVRSDSPVFSGRASASERVILVRLKALMSPGEWELLPELIRERRGLSLHELESDTARSERIARHEPAPRDTEQARRDAERERREAEEWPEALERARREGEERIRREREKESEPANADDIESRPQELQGLAKEGLLTADERQDHSRRIPEEAAPPREPLVGPSRVEDDRAEGTVPPESPSGAEDAMTVEPMSSNAEGAEGSAGVGDGTPAESAADRAEEDASEGPSPSASAAPEGTEDAMTAEPMSSDIGEPDVLAPGGDVTPPGPDGRPAPTQPAGGVAPVASGSFTSGGAAVDLDAYSQRLADAGEQGLAEAVAAYAERVGGVERGDLPPAMSVPPAAVAPDMVGAALVRSPLEGVVEFVRNVLIFMPVLWTWFEFGRASATYGEYVSSLPPDAAADSLLVAWERGFDGAFNSLGDAVFGAVALLVVLIVTNAGLGFSRKRTERRIEKVGRDFAAVLARAETVGAAQRVADPQEALAGFVVAGTALTTELRAVGMSLQQSAEPFADSLVMVRQVLEATTDAVRQQQAQTAEIVERLGRVAQISDALGALQSEFAGAEAAATRSAEALEGIRNHLEPSAGRLDDNSEQLARLAEQLTRMTEVMESSLSGLDSGLDSSAEHLEKAATSMNAVAQRVLDELGDGRSARR